MGRVWEVGQGCPGAGGDGRVQAHGRRKGDRRAQQGAPIVWLWVKRDERGTGEGMGRMPIDALPDQGEVQALGRDLLGGGVARRLYTSTFCARERVGKERAPPRF